MSRATTSKPAVRIRPAGRLRFKALTGGHYEACHNGLEYRYASIARNGGDRMQYEAEVRKPRSRLIVARLIVRTAGEARRWLDEQAGPR